MTDYVEVFKQHHETILSKYPHLEDRLFFKADMLCCRMASKDEYIGFEAYGTRVSVKEVLVSELDKIHPFLFDRKSSAFNVCLDMSDLPMHGYYPNPACLVVIWNARLIEHFTSMFLGAWMLVTLNVTNRDMPNDFWFTPAFELESDYLLWQQLMHIHVGNLGPHLYIVPKLFK